MPALAKSPAGEPPISAKSSCERSERTLRCLRECRLRRRSPHHLPETRQPAQSHHASAASGLCAAFASAGSAGARQAPCRRPANQRKVIMRAKRADFALPNPAVTCARCEPGKPGGCHAVFRPKPPTDKSSLSDCVGSTLECAGHEQGRPFAE